MPLILSLETATDVCSVALHQGTQLLAQDGIHESQSHASMLAPLIDAVCLKAGVSIKEMQAIAVSRGPGSYTGLRIGTSTAKGLCYALDIPLISVGTLELLAFQGNRENRSHALLCPMIDARRMEVYSLVTDDQLNVIQPASANVIDEGSFAELLESSQMLIFGSGSKKCRDVIRHQHAIFLDGVVPQATALGVLAEKKFHAREFEDLVQFRPLYLKEFVAKKAGAGM